MNRSTDREININRYEKKLLQYSKHSAVSYAILTSGIQSVD